MALSAGTRLGPYEILAPLGAGGMGEVYRAKDTRLDRTVAVKVLPGDLAADPHLKARFERGEPLALGLDLERGQDLLALQLGLGPGVVEHTLSHGLCVFGGLRLDRLDLALAAAARAVGLRPSVGQDLLEQSVAWLGHGSIRSAGA